jgi:hypothetical protein
MAPSGHMAGRWLNTATHLGTGLRGGLGLGTGLGTGLGLGTGVGVAGFGLAGRQLTALLAPAVARAWLKAVDAPAERAWEYASAGADREGQQQQW